MMLLALMMSAMIGCADPDDSIPSNIRLLSAGEPCRKPRADKVRPKTGGLPDQKLPSPRPLPPARRLAVQRAINREFFDGPSARVQWPQQVGRADFYCFWANGMNRMGAYAGWKQMVAVFQYDGSAALTDNNLALWNGVDRCAEAGYARQPR